MGLKHGDISIHKNEKIRQLRDPYVWRENDLWNLVLGGQLTRPLRGAIFHYTSEHLENWKYAGILCEGNPKTHKKPWECPNVLKWGKSSVLIISPFDKVQYTINSGNWKELKWAIFDHGKAFYAPNSMKNPDNAKEYLLWGWIKGGGQSKLWNGCFSLPRVIGLENQQLVIKPSPILEHLRINHQHFEYQSEIINLHGGCGELVAIFLKDTPCTIEIYNNPKNTFTIQYDPSENSLKMGEERALIQSQDEIISLHLFIDRSVLEMFINTHECFTSRFYSSAYRDLTLDCKVSGMGLLSLDTWDLKPITQEFPLK
jgi:beta-fructofuranosidase